jgi:hypothetical protein
MSDNEKPRSLEDFFLNEKPNPPEDSFPNERPNPTRAYGSYGEPGSSELYGNFEAPDLSEVQDLYEVLDLPMDYKPEEAPGPPERFDLNERPRSIEGFDRDDKPRSLEDLGINVLANARGKFNYLERRRKSDWIVRMATILSVLSWLVAFSVWVLLDQASPERAHMFSRLFGIPVREHWNTTLLPIAFVLLFVALGICILAFLFNKLRMRRKTDKYRKSIFIIGGITIVSIVLFIMRFGTWFI